jgi:fumarate reductase flavoprotein subunit
MRSGSIKGEGFADESTGANHFESVNAMLLQPGKVSYTLFDEQVKQNIIGRIEKGYIPFRGLAYRANWAIRADLSYELKLEADKGRVKISDSWDEIASWIGAAPRALPATIEEYSYGCDRGYDELFSKDRRYLAPLRKPPYYGIRCYPVFLTTIGGIKINHNMQVLNNDDKPIPGLFAAGNDTGGWEPKDTYNAILSGHAFGFAINSGRIAGENAAGYIFDNPGY